MRLSLPLLVLICSASALALAGFNLWYGNQREERAYAEGVNETVARIRVSCPNGGTFTLKGNKLVIDCQQTNR